MCLFLIISDFFVLHTVLILKIDQMHYVAV